MQVECYSGHTHPERPQSFVWDGAECRVKAVEREWREPGRRHFRVRTEDDRTFELWYDGQTDAWSGREWVLRAERGQR